MFRRGTLGSILVIALGAELIAFLLAAHWIGFGGAILLTLLTSFIGAARLRQSGREALTALRNLNGQADLREGAFVDGALQALGAALLVLPGFLSDFLGMVLIAPSGRRWIGRYFRIVEDTRPKRAGYGPAPTIELGAEDWTRIDNARQR